MFCFLEYWFSPTQQIKRAVLTEINSSLNLTFKDKLQVHQSILVYETVHNEIYIENNGKLDFSVLDFFEYSARGAQKYFELTGENRICYIYYDFCLDCDFPHARYLLHNKDGFKFNTINLNMISPPNEIPISLNDTLEIIETVNLEGVNEFNRDINILKCFPNLNQVNIDFEVTYPQKALLENIVLRDRIIIYVKGVKYMNS